MPPHYITDISFEEECGGGSGDPWEQEAHLIVLRRNWDDILIPVYDMVNHRNGHWTNVDSNSTHLGEDITVFALRDIRKGEQLYLSYTECVDCNYFENFAWYYGLPQTLKDYGFIEQYPRRWNIEGLAFELDQDEETKQISLTFLSGLPNAYQMKFMPGQLKRLLGIKDYVYKEAIKLDSAHEQNMSLEYYHATLTALEYALSEAEASMMKKSALLTTATTRNKPVPYANTMSLKHSPTKWNSTTIFATLIAFIATTATATFMRQDRSTNTCSLGSYSKELDDTCMYLNSHDPAYVHACASSRPPYHEVFVHYLAWYVKDLKRVAFIGGGNNMIVHEILKYPSLELVVGLQLDQAVVRSSFKYFGTQPHFDDERLQWWFGDGSKSILMLPEEYYGTFDVVYMPRGICRVVNFELDIRPEKPHWAHAA